MSRLPATITEGSFPSLSSLYTPLLPIPYKRQKSLTRYARGSVGGETEGRMESPFLVEAIRIYVHVMFCVYHNNLAEFSLNSYGV
jgi:hypothetical protein